MNDKLVHAGAPLVLLLLIARLQDLTSSCANLCEILPFSNSYSGLSFPKTRTLERFCKIEALLTSLSGKAHCWLLELPFKFKGYQVKDRNWFVQ